MVFEQIPIGGDRNFGYIIGDVGTAQAAFIDPAYSHDNLIERLRGLGLVLRFIICTHSDDDHVGGNDYVKEETGAAAILHEDAPAGMADVSVKDGQELGLGNLKLRFIHTPGHTPDSMCILAEDKIATGDTLFVGKIGGTQSRAAAEAQFHSLHEKLMTLDNNIKVYPGHDVGLEPVSTIGIEKATNPFLLQPTFEEFLHLKDH